MQKQGAIAASVLVLLIILVLPSSFPTIYAGSLDVSISNTGTITYTFSSEGLPRLTVSGKTILKDGVPFQLRGVNYPQYIFGWSELNHDAEEQASIMKQWGCTSCMLVLHDRTPLTIGILDELIQANEDNGLYSIIMYQYYGAMHDYSSWGTSQWQSFRNDWIEIAERYKDRTSVLYCLLDEPMGLSYQKYSQEMTNCIDTIREIDPEVICIIDAMNPDAGGWPLDFEFQIAYPINRPNLIFSIHDFVISGSGLSSTEQYRRDWFERERVYDVLDQNRPVWVGSCGYTMGTGAGAWFRSLLGVALEDDLCGFHAWAWHTPSEDDMPILSNWSGGASEMGAILQEYL